MRKLNKTQFGKSKSAQNLAELLNQKGDARLVAYIERTLRVISRHVKNINITTNTDGTVAFLYPIIKNHYFENISKSKTLLTRGDDKVISYFKNCITIRLNKILKK